MCSTKDCRRPVYCRGICRKCYSRMYQNGSLPIVRLIGGDIRERFMRRVFKMPGDFCWRWTGQKEAKGYGLFWDNGRSYKAHRIAWQLRHGRIRRGMSVLHRCDRRDCVRVSHLFLGTQADNMHDMRLKGRAAIGEQVKGAKLTPDKVREMRSLFRAGFTITQLARNYGITWIPARAAITGKTWKHVK